MRIVRVIGGLGNQMFQYAFACKLKKLYPRERVLLDLTHFKGYDVRSFELDYIFNLSIPTAKFRELILVTSPFSINTTMGQFASSFVRWKKEYYEKEEFKFGYDQQSLMVPGSCYYVGYWFSHHYFEDIQNDIRREFDFKRPLDGENSILKNKIDDCNSVSIHVRRGDYLLYDKYKNICEIDYYKNAINYIKEKVGNPHFFIFSNDIDWCREKLLQYLENYSFSINNDVQNNYIDMQLMACCKHNIIAHSSFSWWAAWLNSNPDKIVVAPSKWINSTAPIGKPQLDDWVLID